MHVQFILNLSSNSFPYNCSSIYIKYDKRYVGSLRHRLKLPTNWPFAAPFLFWRFAYISIPNGMSGGKHPTNLALFEPDFLANSASVYSANGGSGWEEIPSVALKFLYMHLRLCFSSIPTHDRPRDRRNHHAVRDIVRGKRSRHYIAPHMPFRVFNVLPLLIQSN